MITFNGFNLFQIGALLFLTLLFVQTIKTTQGTTLIQRAYFSRSLVFAAFAALVVAFPSISTRFATIFGISRGADFIIYASIIWLFYKLQKQYQQITELEQKLDALNRKIAISELHKKDGSKKSSTGN